MSHLGAERAKARLLRVPYHSTPTDDEREYLVYLPAGYDPSGDALWPVILFLHGGGERGDGRVELNFVMWHGPLREAWIRYRKKKARSRPSIASQTRSGGWGIIGWANNRNTGAAQHTSAAARAR